MVGFSGSENTLCDTIIMDICHTLSVSVECTATKSDSYVTYGPLVIMCQCSFITCNKCTSGRGYDTRGGYACVGTGSIWGISVPLPQFCCQP